MHLSKLDNINRLFWHPGFLTISGDLLVKIITGHSFNTFIENTACSQIWDLGKGINLSRLALSFLPNNENMENYTMVTNTVSSVDQRSVSFPWDWMTYGFGQLHIYLPWLRGVCSNIIRVLVMSVHHWWIVRLSKCSSFLEPHLVSEEWGDKLNDKFIIYIIQVFVHMCSNYE